MVAMMSLPSSTVVKEASPAGAVLVVTFSLPAGASEGTVAVPEEQPASRDRDRAAAMPSAKIFFIAISPLK